MMSLFRHSELRRAEESVSLTKTVLLLLLFFGCPRIVTASEIQHIKSIPLPSNVQSLSLSPASSQWAAVLDLSNKLSLMNLASSAATWTKTLPEIPGGLRSFTSLRFSPDGKLLAVSSLLPLPYILILNVATGENVKSISIDVMEQPITREPVIAFDQTGTEIILRSPTMLSQIQTMSLVTGRITATLEIPLRAPGSLAAATISGDNRIICAVFQGGIVLWDRNSGKLLSMQDFSRGDVPSLPITDAVLSSDARLAILVHKTSRIDPGTRLRIHDVIVSDTESNREWRKFQTIGSTRVKFDQKGMRVAAFSANGILQIKNIFDEEGSTATSISSQQIFWGDAPYLAQVDLNGDLNLFVSGLQINSAGEREKAISIWGIK